MNPSLIAPRFQVMVNVDPHEMSQTMPVPHKEVLSSATEPAAAVDWEPADSERDGEAFEWSTTVRLMDCDSNGHINNAIYASLAEEARWLAGQSNGYKGGGNDKISANHRL